MQDNKMPKVQVRNLTKKFGDLLVLMIFPLMCVPENFYAL